MGHWKTRTRRQKDLMALIGVFNGRNYRSLKAVFGERWIIP